MLPGSTQTLAADKKPPLAAKPTHSFVNAGG
jgi:hypothetical protein